jgi:hypothetical protein
MLSRTLSEAGYSLQFIRQLCRTSLYSLQLNGIEIIQINAKLTEAIQKAELHIHLTNVERSRVSNGKLHT